VRDTGKFFILQCGLDFLVVQMPATRETRVGSLGWEDFLEKKMATHSSILALKIPWVQEPVAGYSPWGHKESDMTERLHFLSLSGTPMFISLAPALQTCSTHPSPGQSNRSHRTPRRPRGRNPPSDGSSQLNSLNTL